MSGLNGRQKVHSVFLGGGTPSHLDTPQLERLMSLVHGWFDLEPGHEFTIEANPETLDADKVAILADHGVNRVSLGVQSFAAALLHALERRHDPASVEQAVAMVRRRIKNISFDLIFAVPGQDLAAWRTDLERALALEPTHLSTYGLTFEKGTTLWKQRRQGLVQSLDENTELAMYLEAMDVLASAGFEHYEISSFARPGWQCRHNRVYWANEAYFGFGLGAARYVRGCRELNTRSFADYLRRALAGDSPVMQAETLPPNERARETVAVQLRRGAGIHRHAFASQTGFELDMVAGEALRRQVELGLLVDDGVQVRLTRRGKCVADAVIADILK
jgi:oxygen-independent coproporphyrinogen-3 oxidase